MISALIEFIKRLLSQPIWAVFALGIVGMWGYAWFNYEEDRIWYGLFTLAIWCVPEKWQHDSILMLRYVNNACLLIVLILVLAMYGPGFVYYGAGGVAVVACILGFLCIIQGQFESGKDFILGLGTFVPLTIMVAVGLPRVFWLAGGDLYGEMSDYTFQQGVNDLPLVDMSDRIMCLFALGALLLVIIREFLWLLPQIKQLRNLPTAKARSAAMGLVEVSGIARSVNETGNTVIYSGFDKAQPFDLEDESGTIRVEPPKKKRISGFISKIFGLSVPVYDCATINDGDHVYVVGNIMTRTDKKGNSRKVLSCRHADTNKASGLDGEMIQEFLGGRGHQRKDEDVFFIASGVEEDVHKRMRFRLITGVITVILFIALSTYAMMSRHQRLTLLDHEIISPAIQDHRLPQNIRQALKFSAHPHPGYQLWSAMELTKLGHGTLEYRSIYLDLLISDNPAGRDYAGRILFERDKGRKPVSAKILFKALSMPELNAKKYALLKIINQYRVQSQNQMRKEYQARQDAAQEVLKTWPELSGELRAMALGVLRTLSCPSKDMLAILPEALDSRNLMCAGMAADTFDLYAEDIEGEIPMAVIKRLMELLKYDTKLEWPPGYYKDMAGITPRVGDEAAGALMKCGKVVVPLIRERLNDSSDSLVKRALKILSKLDTEESLTDIYISFIKRDELATAELVMKLSRELSVEAQEKIRPHIWLLAKSKSKNTLYACQSLLYGLEFELNKVDRDWLLRFLTSEARVYAKNCAWSILVKNGADRELMIATIGKALKDFPDDTEQYCKWLGETRKEAIVILDTLVPLLDSQEHCRPVIELLGKLGPKAKERAGEKIAAMFLDQEKVEKWYYHYQALDTLTAWGDFKTLGIYLEGMGDRHTSNRHAVFDRIEKAGKGAITVLPSFIKILKERSYKNEYKIIRILRDLGPLAAPALPMLRERLEIESQKKKGGDTWDLLDAIAQIDLPQYPAEVPERRLLWEFTPESANVIWYEDRKAATQTVDGRTGVEMKSNMLATVKMDKINTDHGFTLMFWIHAKNHFKAKYMSMPDEFRWNAWGRRPAFESRYDKYDPPKKEITSWTVRSIYFNEKQDKGWFPSQTWTHMAVTLDPYTRSVKAYANGELKQVDKNYVIRSEWSQSEGHYNGLGYFKPNWTEFHIGDAWQRGGTYPGVYADIKLYNYPMDEKQIQQAMNE